MIGLLLLLLAAEPMPPMPPMPATPAGAYVAMFLEDYNSGELAKRDPAWARWYSLYGRLRYESTASSTPDDIRIWTKSEVTDTWVGVHVAMDPAPPHTGMKDMGVVTGHHPADAPRPAPLPDAMASVDAYLQKLATADAFSGVVLIAKDGAPLYEKAFGMASRRYGVPNGIDTRFNVGSVTKVLTAVAIAQLAEAGKLSYQDRVTRFVPSVTTDASIHQLLNHTAGIPHGRDPFSDRFPRSLAELVARIGFRAEF